jgi:hypothetical protein
MDAYFYVNSLCDSISRRRRPAEWGGRQLKNRFEDKVAR